MRNVVSDHRGHESSVMNLDARNIVLKNESSPLGVHARRIRQKTNDSFRKTKGAICVCGRLAVSVLRRRSSRHIPEFCTVLRCGQKIMTSRFELSQRVPNRSVLNLGSPDEPQKDVSIDEVNHGLWMISVNPFATDGVIGQLRRT